MSKGLLQDERERSRAPRMPFVTMLLQGIDSETEVVSSSRIPVNERAVERPFAPFLA